MVMTMCCNWSNLSYYRASITSLFKHFDQSSMSDHFYKLLFQFTEEMSEIRPMFIETDDYLKHSFFGGGYLAKL